MAKESDALINEFEDGFEDTEAQEQEAVFEIKGRKYRIGYNLQRLQLAEQMAKSATMAILTANNGMLSLQELMIYFACGLCELGGKYIKPQKGLEFAEKYLKKHGYVQMNVQVVEAIQRDCGFLFQTS